jgi:hypothetical protein
VARVSCIIYDYDYYFEVKKMDFEKTLGDSFAYTREAIAGKWMQWLLLVIATILLCLPLLGYILKIFRGEKPAPEVTGWGTLFVDGLKYVIVTLVWAIPLLILFLVLIGAAFLPFSSITSVSESGIQASSGNPALIIGALGVYLVVVIIVGLLTVFFSTIGIIRFARTGRMGEAFNISEILTTIRKIGWGTYIISLVVLFLALIVIEVVITILGIIPVLGVIIQVVFIAPVMIFEARYLCQIYDAAGAA